MVLDIDMVIANNNSVAIRIAIVLMHTAAAIGHTSNLGLCIDFITATADNTPIDIIIQTVRVRASSVAIEEAFENWSVRFKVPNHNHSD